MFITILAIAIYFLNINSSIAQRASGIGLELGYTHNEKSLGYIGAEFATHSGLAGRESSGNAIFSFGGGCGGYWGRFNGSSRFIFSGNLSLGISNFSDNSNSLGLAYEIRVTASKYFINPAIGLNFLNFAKLHVGYSFANGDIKGIEMKGPTIALTLSLGSFEGYHGFQLP